jgi:hypothetical protein
MPSFRRHQKLPMTQHILKLTAFARVRHVLVPALAFHALVHVQVEVAINEFFKESNQ